MCSGFLQCPSLNRNPLSPKTVQFCPLTTQFALHPEIAYMCPPRASSQVVPYILNCVNVSSQGLIPQQSLPIETTQLCLSRATKKDDMIDDSQGAEEKNKHTKKPKVETT